MFKTASDYHELNAGAHRKPPKILSAPSLVWHLAFWTNFPVSNSEGGKSKRSPARIKKLVDDYVLALCTAIGDKVANLHLTPCISGTCLLFDRACRETTREPVKIADLTARQDDIFRSTARSVSLQFAWKKLDVTIRFEIYTEYFLISTFVELDKTREKKSGGLYSDLDSLNDKIKLILDYLGRADRSSSDADDDASQSSDDDLAKKINKYCFHDFWEVFEKEILSHDSLADFTKDGIFKQIFADFRGVIASEQAVKFADEDFFKAGKPATWGQQAKAKFLPLIQHRDRGQHTRYECAVNYMLDGRALYMSTLGPQLPSMPEHRRIPVEFIVYAHQRYNDTTVVNKWQLGRLVSQILLLGTLRLSALKDVKSLHEAGQLMGQLDEFTQAARDAIALTELDASVSEENSALTAGPDQSAAPTAKKTMVKALGEAHIRFNAIAGTFLEDTGSGLNYRIERSRFYVKLFEDNVKLLRIQRVEGDQPYDQFIRRRLGSEFDFIDRLGIRYERAIRTMETLNQSYLAIIQGRLAAIQTEIDGDTNKIQVDIHRIQEWGEFALLAALVPYYVVHLLEKLMPDRFVPGMTIVLWSCLAAFAFWRVTKVKRYSVMVILAGIVLLLIHVFLVFSGSETPRQPGNQIQENRQELQKSQNDPRDVSKPLPDTAIKPPDVPKPDVPKDDAAPPPSNAEPPPPSGR
jgi:hypothetical protein